MKRTLGLIIALFIAAVGLHAKADGVFLNNTSSLSNGIVGTRYVQSVIFVYTGTGTPTIDVEDLPTGLQPDLNITKDGNDYSFLIIGTPAISGTFPVYMRYTDGETANAETLNLTITGVMPTSPTEPVQPVQPAPPVSNVHPIGTNILMPDGTVEMVTVTGRRPYTSAGAFLSYGFNSWTGIVDESSGDEILSIGSYIPPRDGTIVCSDRGNDKGTCYLITRGQKAGFVSASVFLGSGFSFNRTIIGDVSWMNRAKNIDSATSAHITGTLIDDNGTYELVTVTGLLGIPDIATLNSWGYVFEDAVPANQADSKLNKVGVLQVRTLNQLEIQS